MTIWVNEQIDPCGIVYSCIACCNKEAAQDCHLHWQNNLTLQQKQENQPGGEVQQYHSNISLYLYL